MEKTPDTSIRDIPFSAIESGMMAGLWAVSIEGFEWRNDIRPAIVDGQLHVIDPPELSWWLVPKGEVARQYPVLAQIRLTRDFHQLALDPTRPTVMAFASRYGLLGNASMLVPRGQSATGRVVFQIGGPSTLIGEDWAYWQTEALAFRNLWETWQLVRTLSNQEGSTAAQVIAAHRELESRFGWHADGSIWHHHRVEGAGAKVSGDKLVTYPGRRDHKVIAANVPRNDVAAAARFYVIGEVNDQLKGRVNPTIFPFRSATLRFVPDTLRTAIYLRFAFEISEGIGRQLECAGCTQPFVPKRRDQVFCGKNCRERASYRRRIAGQGTERDLST